MKTEKKEIRLTCMSRAYFMFHKRTLWDCITGLLIRYFRFIVPATLWRH